MSAAELAEWKAYERHAGPLGTAWRDELLGQMHEQIQQLNFLFSQANFTDKNHKKGPVPKPERYPRPHEAFGKRDPLVLVGNDDDEEWITPPDVSDEGAEDQQLNS